MGYEMGYTKLEILQALADGEKKSEKEIRDEVGVEYPVTKQLSRFLAQSLVKREKVDLEGMRPIWVYWLTKWGRKMLRYYEQEGYPDRGRE